MVERDAGHLVNIGSVRGRLTLPGGEIYCASKFAVSAITEGLRVDLFGKKIRVPNIEPGMVKTEFSRARLGTKQQRTPYKTDSCRSSPKTWPKP
jgi:NADP-dependent 3-hydroxy acid dehydrogenase YdfG